MAKFNSKQIDEINAIIAEINKSLKVTHEIGARDRAILSGLLQANSIKQKPKYFACHREYSESIIAYFTKEKFIAKNKFSMNTQPFVYLIDPVE